MAHEEYIQAAIASRLFPDRLSAKEIDYIDDDDVQEYLAARNFVLYQWLKRPDRILTWESLSNDNDTSSFMDQHNVSLEFIKYSFQFCHRYRYINYGRLLALKVIRDFVIVKGGYQV